MKRGSVLQIASFVVSRVVFLYLVIAAGLFWGTDHRAVIRSARLQALSRLTPGFDYHEAFFRESASRSRKDLEEGLYYHKMVADLVPPVAGEALAVAGFCAYELGRRQEAVALIQRSVKANPVLFWNHYNLGIIAFNTGDYQQARKAFAQALQMDSKYTLYFLLQSKVYTDIRRSFRTDYDAQRTLAVGYERAMGLMRLSVVCEADPAASVCQQRPRLRLQIF